MIYKKLLCSLALVAMFCSCSSDVMDMPSQEANIATQESLIYLDGVPFSQENDMLSFATIEEFQQAVKGMENNRIVMENLGTYVPMQEEVNRLQLEGFTSIYDAYEEALNEADNYYDSESHYAEFKEKYASLYFPEHEDDYSVYLPVSDRNVAKLLNVNGDVMIGNEVINMKDIFTYEKLVELGETMTDDGISTLDYTGDYLNGTPELKNGGDRKLRIRVYTKPGSDGVGEIVVVDVSFRKKGAFGAWYNYKSTTTLGSASGKSWKKDGFSSHDYKFAREYRGGKPLQFIDRMYIEYQGFRGEKVFFNVDI